MMYEKKSKIQNVEIYNECLMHITTVHGFLRTMERTGKNERQAYRFICNAWFRGKDVNQMMGGFQRKYLSYFESITAEGRTKLRVYDEYLFVFSANGRLITMHLLPPGFSKRFVYDGKTKVRNVRKYHHFNYCEVSYDEWSA